jgi:hypothetical protein
MYGRDTWYPELGFSKQEFLPALQRDGVHMCNGAFPGACDGDVAKWIGNRLEARQSGRPTFVHWVTLNSHLPVAPVQGIEADESCHAAGIDDHGSLCAWFDRVLDVHKSVADLATRPGIGPTVFVIVGDHAPPFLRPDARDRFSQAVVPWVVLMPRSMSTPQRVLVASAPKSAETAQERRATTSGKSRTPSLQRQPHRKRTPGVTPKVVG